jgi:heme-degrading monooxygenase HmoA
MNQVQEMPQLEDINRLPEAIERLHVVTAMMQAQPGFLGAEVLQNVAIPTKLLVLHAWRDLADWQTFEHSPEKLEFMAGRPQGLYSMAKCGMNWRSRQADGVREGATLRREVIRRSDLELRSGDEVAGSQTFVYHDDLPQFVGCTLRLTRLAGANVGTDAPDPGALVDETYVSLFSVNAPLAQSSAEAAAGA